MQFCLNFCSLALACACNFPRILHIYVNATMTFFVSVHTSASRKQSWLSFRIDFVQILITVAMTITFYASWYIFPSISISIGKTWRNNINKFRENDHEKKKLSLRRYNYQVMNLINEGLKGFVQKWDSYIDTFAIFRLWKPKRRINR